MGRQKTLNRMVASNTRI